MNNQPYHFPVLLNEIKEIVENTLKKGIFNKVVFIDCTLGLGGHTLNIIPLLPFNSYVYLIDKDSESINIAKTRIEKNIPNFDKRNINFLNTSFLQFFASNCLDTEIFECSENLAIILMDLGLSYYQIKNQQGFSFNQDSFLDMRYDKSSVFTAYQIINTFSQENLYNVFNQIFENKKIVKKIVEIILKERTKKEIKSTFDLNKIVSKVISSKYLKDVLQKVYLALRIAVNNELEELKDTLGIIYKLKTRKLLLIITYHSLEGKVVKEFIKKLGKNGISFEKIKPSKEEVKINKPSRSAILWLIKENI